MLMIWQETVASVQLRWKITDFFFTYVQFGPIHV